MGCVLTYGVQSRLSNVFSCLSIALSPHHCLELVCHSIESSPNLQGRLDGQLAEFLGSTCLCPWCLDYTKLGRFELWSLALNSSCVYSFKHFPRPRVKYFKIGNLFSHFSKHIDQKKNTEQYLK